MKTRVHAALLAAIAATGGCSWLSLFVDVETACASDAACPADRPFCVADVCREVVGVGEGEGDVVVGEGEGEGDVGVGEGEGEFVGEGEGEVVGEGEGEVVGEGEGEEGLCDLFVEPFTTEPLRLVAEGDAEFVRQLSNDALVISVPSVEGGLFFTPALLPTAQQHLRWEMVMSEGLPMVFGQQAYVGFIDETGSAAVLMIVLEGTLIARIDVGGATFDDVAVALDPMQKDVALSIEIEETTGGVDVTWRAGLPGQLSVVRNDVLHASGVSFAVPAVVVQNFAALEQPAREIIIDEVRLSGDCPP